MTATDPTSRSAPAGHAPPQPSPRAPVGWLGLLVGGVLRRDRIIRHRHDHRGQPRRLPAGDGRPGALLRQNQEATRRSA